MKNSKAEEPLESYNRPVDFEQVWLMFQETDKKFQETDKMLSEKFQETDKMLSEKFQETDKKIKELSNLFTTQWGKLVESLVEGDLVKLLNEKGITVESTIQRRKGSRDGNSFEFDIIAVNGTEIVIVEVKTTLRPNDVKNFLKKLKLSKEFMPEYKESIVYGAVAFIAADAGSEKMAENKGLLVIKATGNSSSIINKVDFNLV